MGEGLCCRGWGHGAGGPQPSSSDKHRPLATPRLPQHRRAAHEPQRVTGLTCSTHVAVEPPVVVFKLADENVHGASDLKSLQEQVGLLPPVHACGEGGACHRAAAAAEPAGQCRGDALARGGALTWF